MGAPEMCTCKPDDGSRQCPREDECYENWLDAQRAKSRPATHLPTDSPVEPIDLAELGRLSPEEYEAAWHEANPVEPIDLDVLELGERVAEALRGEAE